MNGQVKNEGNVEIGGFGPYPISFRSLIPKASECTNLIVPVCLSATHIAYGSIRMEPVFMVLAQSSATAAVMAINSKTDIQKTDIASLQNILTTNPLADGSAFDVLVDNDNAKLVTTTGAWTSEKKGGYGPSYLVTTDKNSTVRFSTSIDRKGKYNCFIYVPKVAGPSSVMSASVTVGKNKVEKTINPAEVIVEGQTSGEWVSLGTYTLSGKETVEVEVSAKNADGKVVADAVIWTPVKN